MGKVSTYGYTDAGGRKENEDTGCIKVYEQNIVAVIADGLGGQGGGKAAAELAVRILIKCGEKKGFPDEQAVSLVFQEANEAVLHKQQNKFHMKTTAVYLCIHGKSAIWAHIGDSRLYHFWNGKLCHYTLDHSMSQLAVALGEISRDDIPKHSQRSRLLHALGCEEEEGEVHAPVTLEAGMHAFLLCTDGFWEYLEEKEIQEELEEASSAQAWVQGMRKRIQSRCGNKNDNNTAAAILLEV